MVNKNREQEGKLYKNISKFVFAVVRKKNLIIFLWSFYYYYFFNLENWMLKLVFPRNKFLIEEIG